MKHLLTLAIVAITSVLSSNAQSVNEDLLMHDFVGGKVKRYVQIIGEFDNVNFQSKDYNVSWTYFDTSGRLIRDGVWKVFVYDNNGRYVRGQFQNATIERNERGHITSIKSGSVDNSDIFYDYNYIYNDYGTMTSMTYDAAYSDGTVKFFYDDNNDLVGDKTEYNAEGNEGEITSTYTITRRDGYGNWIERNVKKVEKEMENGKVTNTINENYTEIRYIEYYEPGEKSVLAERFIIPVTVKGSNVRLRLGPSTNHQILTKNGKPVYPAKGAKLNYLGETEEFYRVAYQGAEAYISKQFSERVEEDFLMQ